MLTLILGRAGTGKTTYIMNEIKRRVNARETGTLLIVPEQYSHYAERQLCEVCGDELSLFAETMSFTRLSITVLAETGSAGICSLDVTGQILAMNKAVETISRDLTVYGKEKRTRTETLEKLLDVVTEFRNLNITVNTLKAAAKKTSNPLKDKLNDLALIFEAYNQLLLEHGGDTAERISLLAERISDSSIGKPGKNIYIDGFNDFTAHEIKVIEALLSNGASITVCITCDPEDKSEIFEIPLKTVSLLRKMAIKQGKECKEINVASGDTPRSPELSYLEEHLFKELYIENDKVYKGQCEAVEIYSAPSKYTECEYAAYEVLKFVRSGYRWRDVGVMARDWDEYGSICENVFERYEIPYFTSGKADVLGMPPLTLIDAALDIAARGFEFNSIFRYIKTGLLDITPEECAVLENYVQKWQIRGNSWNREWKMPTQGYGRSRNDEQQLLERINDIRQRVIKPLQSLREGIKGESTSEKKLYELYSFLENIQLPESLTKKAKVFIGNDEFRLADEYTQLWDITISAMEQMHSILKKDLLNAVEFHKLFILALSQKNVGVIPVSLDRTALGGMAMNRRRDLKCLILLGATDDNIPKINKSSGALSENERSELKDIIKDIPAGLDDRLQREMNILYSTLTLPSKKLVVMYPKHEKQRPSFIITRLHNMFSIPELTLEQEEYMVSAKIPYNEFSNQLTFLRGDTSGTIPVRMKEQLSEKAAEALYGKGISLSATRVNSYYECPYSYFLKYGLKLEAQKQAEYDGLAAGNFLHDLLENIIKNIKSDSEYINVDTCLKMAKMYINEYEQKILLDFDDKNNKRLEYLFRRYTKNINYIVRDTVDELNASGFKPLSPELDMKELSDKLTGKIDRVDGYEHKGKQYIRVIDYKTHTRAYSLDLCDVLYGRNLQMLMYLFALEKYGHTLYKKEIVAAGVLYAPARDNVLNVKRDKINDDETIDRSRVNDLRRSGLILNDPEVIEAMESGKTKKYLPKMEEKDGVYSGDSLVSSEQLALLSEHVSNLVHSAELNIQNGDNNCSPYYAGEQNNGCLYCDYYPVCGFDEENGDKRRTFANKKPEEVWAILEAKNKKMQ